MGEEKLTEEEKKMSMDERLDKINNEIYLLYKMCLDNGYKPKEIEQFAQPILSSVTEARRRRYMKRMLFGAVVLALIACFIYYEPVYRGIQFYFRVGLMNLLPYWNWSKLYNRECLVDNPFYEGDKLTEEDCKLCANLTDIPRLQNVSEADMADKYITPEVPVIITDAMENWPARDLFSLEWLIEQYENVPQLKKGRYCDYYSNYKLKLGSVKIFLKAIATGKLKKFYARWENCDKATAKVFREYYNNRPYFLPPMVEQADSNMFVISSNYTQGKYKPIYTDSSLIWYAQIKGAAEIRIKAYSPCNATCPELKTTLHPGEILVVSQMLWMLDVMVNDPGESIAIAAGGKYDTVPAT
ncbi:uncharacterized protein LOC106178086 [Lingula anatina]|uniref:Uncharacterized protein LOC106178086 n=1 Tax=Lingula anatina TaxID=7574 RepID=A0A1S3K2E9_LINAN|nr:uncharacterized protein LOC106178086 [Lingula anatina]|eukprot:XP_013416569.1 uncharacterized protein LOC106178086 [Lingula anatina]